MEYTILKNKDIFNLKRLIELHRIEGWRLRGELIPAYQDGVVCYTQIMTIAVKDDVAIKEDK